MKPEWLVKINYGYSNKIFQITNLASFYLCLCMHINSLITLLRNVISWETKTTINMQVYASRMLHAQRHICF